MEERELLIITEKYELLYDPTKTDEIMAAVCYKATRDEHVLEGALKIAAALIGVHTESKSLQLRFNEYIQSVRNTFAQQAEKQPPGSPETRQRP
ncbi:MAG: hypothetical protein J6O51_00985 [Bacteroidales bacterium]|nr:hypothetical protein [Bacteroidales bacterium]